MASVTSLDKDLKNLRLEKYTPQRTNEAREWIESALDERLSSPDLLEGLKDGVALCKLINAILGPGTLKIKQSNMPFVQMEQISHFLRACQAAPILLPQHDCFLTVDLYEQKDPAQVLQCISAFSRRAAALQPTRFPSGIGGVKPSTLSPQASGVGGSARQVTSPGANGRTSPTKNYASSPPGASTWAKKSDVHSTAPAWNIAQYGWTGGASQGNQGVTFGGRRQIVSSQPQVPSSADKERRRREQEAEAERQAKEAKEQRQLREAQQQEEGRLAAEEEAQRWDEQARLQREQERHAVEDEKRRWQAEEQRWREEEEQRQREEKEAEAKLERDRAAKPKLHGQFLSQYQSESANRAGGEGDRIKELERQLAEARERERKYEEERQKRQHTGSSQPSSVTGSTIASTKKEPEAPIEDEWSAENERSFLRQQHSSLQKADTAPPRPLPVPGAQAPSFSAPRPLPIPGKKPSFQPASVTAQTVPRPEPSKSPRPLPNPHATPSQSTAAPTQPESIHSPRPLPNPSTYKPTPQTSNRTDTFLASHPAPMPTSTSTFTPSEAAFNSSAEQANEDARRAASQQKTKAGGWAAKSLIEREMERELERAREWEESQKATQAAYERGDVDKSAGSGPGQGFNTSQYGFVGGDNLNNGGGGVYAGRRQILGPRAMGNGK